MSMLTLVGAITLHAVGDAGGSATGLTSCCGSSARSGSLGSWGRRASQCAACCLGRLRGARTRT